MLNASTASVPVGPLSRLARLKKKSRDQRTSTLESAKAAPAQISTLPKHTSSLGDGLLFSGGARTAWMHEAWNKNFTETDTGNVIYPATDPEVYRQQVRLFHQAGAHVGTRAIGDRAIDWVVDTYAEILKEKPTRGLRHSIIHANLTTDHAIRRDGVVAETIRRRLPRGAGPVYVV